MDTLGDIRFPLGKNQARQLIKLCHQAPYGKGVETLVDTKVRKTWELDAGQFEVKNPDWSEVVNGVVANVHQELGLENHKLVAHPYKLLVYEKGSFFLRHRDGEKLDRMVATRVIGLPSVYTGGELKVYHEKQQHKVVLKGARSGYGLSYAPFYADCEHEICPVKSGFRLCLIYNLTLAKTRGKKGIHAIH